MKFLKETLILLLIGILLVGGFSLIMSSVVFIPMALMDLAELFFAIEPAFLRYILLGLVLATLVTIVKALVHLKKWITIHQGNWRQALISEFRYKDGTTIKQRLKRAAVGGSLFLVTILLAKIIAYNAGLFDVELSTEAAAWLQIPSDETPSTKRGAEYAYSISFTADGLPESGPELISAIKSAQDLEPGHQQLRFEEIKKRYSERKFPKLKSCVETGHFCLEEERASAETEIASQQPLIDLYRLMIKEDGLSVNLRSSTRIPRMSFSAISHVVVLDLMGLGLSKKTDLMQLRQELEIRNRFWKKVLQEQHSSIEKHITLGFLDMLTGFLGNAVAANPSKFAESPRFSDLSEFKIRNSEREFQHIVETGLIYDFKDLANFFSDIYESGASNPILRFSRKTSIVAFTAQENRSLNDAYLLTADLLEPSCARNPNLSICKRARRVFNDRSDFAKFRNYIGSSMLSVLIPKPESIASLFKLVEEHNRRVDLIASTIAGPSQSNLKALREQCVCGRPRRSERVKKK